MRRLSQSISAQPVPGVHRVPHVAAVIPRLFMRCTARTTLCLYTRTIARGGTTLGRAAAHQTLTLLVGHVGRCRGVVVGRLHGDNRAYRADRRSNAASGSWTPSTRTPSCWPLCLCGYQPARYYTQFIIVYCYCCWVVLSMLLRLALYRFGRCRA